MTDFSWKDRPVLITGGAGFLGSHLIESLLLRGAKITCLDSLDEPWRLKHLLREINYVSTDVAYWVYDEKIKFDSIFHLAAFSFPYAVQNKPELAYRQNVMITANMLSIAYKYKIRKFIFTSAGALYSNIPSYLPIDEKHPIDPSQSVYATTKRIGEMLCDDFFRWYGLPVLYFRLFNTYGPRQALEYLVPSFVIEASTKGSINVRNEKIRRDFTYVTDMVEGLIKGAESDYNGGPINLGSGKEHSIGEMAKKIAALVGIEKVVSLNEKVFGPERHVCDNSLARRVLNWKPAVTLEEGLRLTVDAYKKEELVLNK